MADDMFAADCMCLCRNNKNLQRRLERRSCRLVLLLGAQAVSRRQGMGTSEYCVSCLVLVVQVQGGSSHHAQTASIMLYLPVCEVRPAKQSDSHASYRCYLQDDDTRLQAWKDYMKPVIIREGHPKLPAGQKVKEIIEKVALVSVGLRGQH